MPDQRDTEYFMDNSEHPSVLLHADLKGEHILVASDTGRVVGILDFTDVQIGDPSIDIAGVAISVGTTMAVRVGLGAGYPESVVARGICLARCNTILLLDLRLNGDDDSPEDLLRSQMARAWQSAIFSLTADEISERQ